MTIKWASKPVIVEAVQWTGYNAIEVREFGFDGYLAGLEEGSIIVCHANSKIETFSQAAFYALYERFLVWEDNV
jgi:hypothetical protein